MPANPLGKSETQHSPVSSGTRSPPPCFLLVIPIPSSSSSPRLLVSSSSSRRHRHLVVIISSSPLPRMLFSFGCFASIYSPFPLNFSLRNSESPCLTTRLCMSGSDSVFRSSTGTQLVARWASGSLGECTVMSGF